MMRLCARVVALALVATLAVPLFAEQASAAVTLTVETPEDLGIGGPFEPFSSTTSTGAADILVFPVRHDITITGQAGFDSIDLVLQHDPDGEGGSGFENVVLTDGPGPNQVTGEIDPHAGVSLPPSSTVENLFQIAANLGAPTGALTITIDLNTVINGSVVGEPLASGTDTTTVIAPTLVLDLPGSIGVGGGPVVFTGTGTVTNATGSDYDPTRVDVTLSGPVGFDIADVDVEVSPDEGVTWDPVTLANGAANTVVGMLDDAAGFPLPDGTTVEFDLRISAALGAPVGTVTMDADLVRLDEGEPASPPLATVADTMAIAVPTVTLDLPAQFAKGADPVVFAGSISNDTGSDYGAVRYDITIDGPVGFDSTDLTLECDPDGGGPLGFSSLPLTDGSGVITTFCGPQAGSELLNGASLSPNFRAKVLTSAPTGAVDVTVGLDVISSGTPVVPPITTLDKDSAIVAAPGVGVTMPATMVRGAAPTGGNVTIAAPTIGDYSGVHLEVRFTAESALEDGDLALAYVDPNQDGTVFVPVALAEDGDELVGTFPDDGTLDLPDDESDFDFIITAASDAPLGDLTLTVTFLRGTEELGQASDTGEIVEVSPATTTVALAVAPNPVNQGQSVTLTATVDAVADVAPPPSGTVHFKMGGIEVGTAAVGSNGVATLVVPVLLAPGAYPVVAEYDANAPLSDSTSNTVTLTVRHSTKLARFIDSVYRAVLLRPVDQPGLAFWTNEINRTGSRDTFTFAVLFTDEVRARNCTNFYQVYLGRMPDTPGLLYCISLLQQGLQLDDVETTITGSAEYLSLAGGTNNAFLDRLYAQVLGRPIEAAARAFYLQRLAEGAPRAFVSATVLHSSERSGIFVEFTYLSVLGRGSDPAGKAYWVGQIDSGVREEALVALLYGSNEYFNKIS